MSSSLSSNLGTAKRRSCAPLAAVPRAQCGLVAPRQLGALCGAAQLGPGPTAPARSRAARVDSGQLGAAPAPGTVNLVGDLRAVIMPVGT